MMTAGDLGHFLREQMNLLLFIQSRVGAVSEASRLHRQDHSWPAASPTAALWEGHGMGHGSAAQVSKPPPSKQNLILGPSGLGMFTQEGEGQFSLLWPLSGPRGRNHKTWGSAQMHRVNPLIYPATWVVPSAPSHYYLTLHDVT